MAELGLDLQLLFKEAFSNQGALSTLREAINADDMKMNVTPVGISISFTRDNKLETLLTKPKQVHVGPTRRRTKYGTQQVKGYTMNTPEIELEQMIQAQEEDARIEADITAKIEQYIENCLESINMRTINSSL